MALVSLKMSGFRNIETANLEFSPGLNVLSGTNAAGKTSVLEAIYFLGRAHSFRTRRAERLIREGEAGFELVARLKGPGGTPIPFGFSKQGRQLTIRVNGQDVKRMSELASWLPVQLIAGDIHQLLEAGPHYRRQFLDWGVFHVEPGYAATWRRYQRLLKQRNAALRSRRPLAQIHVWTEALRAAAAELSTFRTDYVKRLLPYLIAEMEVFLPDAGEVSLDYHPGVPAGKTFADCLAHHVEQDIESGFTRYGPHRGDLHFRAGRQDLVPRLSRGQQKLLVIALRLAQAALDRDTHGRPSLFLIDDLGAELDAGNQQKVVERLAAIQAQVFVTLVEGTAAPRWPDVPRKLFHVKHGHVVEVV